MINSNTRYILSNDFDAPFLMQLQALNDCFSNWNDDVNGCVGTSKNIRKVKSKDKITTKPK